MKYKIIAMVDDKVTFTKEELEQLLEEVYQDGVQEGRSKIPSLWPPGVKEISGDPSCLSKTITFNGEAPTMTLKDEIAHSSPCKYDAKTNEYIFYPVGKEVK